MYNYAFAMSNIPAAISSKTSVFHPQSFQQMTPKTAHKNWSSASYHNAAEGHKECQNAARFCQSLSGAGKS